MAASKLYVCLLLLLSFSTIGHSDNDCVYTMYIRTGSIFKGGTDSIISVTLYDKNGYGVRISNIEDWGGLMGPNYDYFERGNLDIFSGKGRCLQGPVCALNLTSDGSGWHHGWYCNYVEVTTTGVHRRCAQQYFKIDQWLALNTAPYNLTAIRNNCFNTTGDQKQLFRSESKQLSDLTASE
ncbi:hypothetical protein K2173_005118 [Erythroxylum novogranatense]|uniref:PLAT domain-containing protein n=1 Tax=Erythroxylum novogranatense TaxID=1862640 RepID=A0AAV8TU96_9ROSI|nr:hypothetical protein K2173_005118 [Erythroxylum novogranatense]